MNDTVILIQFRAPFEEIEDVAIAANRQLARKYTEELKQQYPDAYSNGMFQYTELSFITEKQEVNKQ